MVPTLNCVSKVKRFHTNAQRSDRKWLSHRTRAKLRRMAFNCNCLSDNWSWQVLYAIKRGSSIECVCKWCLQERAAALSKTLMRPFLHLVAAVNGYTSWPFSVSRTCRWGPFCTPCSFIGIVIWAFYRSRRLNNRVGCHGAEHQCVMCDDGTTSVRLCGNDIWPVEWRLLLEWAGGKCHVQCHTLRQRDWHIFPPLHRKISVNIDCLTALYPCGTSGYFLEELLMITFLCEIWLNVISNSHLRRCYAHASLWWWLTLFYLSEKVVGSILTWYSLLWCLPGLPLGAPVRSHLRTRLHLVSMLAVVDYLQPKKGSSNNSNGFLTAPLELCGLIWWKIDTRVNDLYV